MKVRLTLSVDDTEESGDGGEDVTPHFSPPPLFPLSFAGTAFAFLALISNFVSLSAALSVPSRKREGRAAFVIAFPTYRVPVNRRYSFRPGS